MHTEDIFLGTQPRAYISSILLYFTFNVTLM